MTRVLHTGDTHLGYRQYHSPERRADFLRAFEQVIADAVELGVDAVVHAGDLFHDTRPELDDLLATLAALRDLSAAEIPFLAIVGNHEQTRDRQWIDLFEQLDLAVHLDQNGTVIGDVTFYGIDYLPTSQAESLEGALTPAETPHTAVVAHGLFEPFAHAEWETSAFLSRLSLSPDTLLLGDNHQPGQATVDDTLVTYCGSTERASASEESARGYNLVSFADGEVHLSRRSLSATRTFEYVTVELAPGEGLDRIRDSFADRDLADAVVIARIEGDGAEVTPAAVEELALDAGALVARVDDSRDQDRAEDHEVTFADPSRAIDDRLRSMTLSPAAHDVESIVRDPDIADTNVRDRATERVRSLLETDVAAFEPATGTQARQEDGGAPAEPVATDEAAGAEDAATADETAPTRQHQGEDASADPSRTPADSDAPSESDEGEDQRSLFDYP